MKEVFRKGLYQYTFIKADEKLLFFSGFERLLLRKIFIKGMMKIDTFHSLAFQKKFLQKNSLDFLQLGV